MLINTNKKLFQPFFFFKNTHCVHSIFLLILVMVDYFNLILLQNQMGQEISKTPNGAEFGRAMDFPKREAHIKETHRDETKCQLIKQDRTGQHSTTRQPSVERQSFSSKQPKESERIVQWSRRDHLLIRWA